MGVFIFVLILRMNFLKEKSVGIFFFKVFLKFMKINITGTHEHALVIAQISTYQQARNTSLS